MSTKGPQHVHSPWKRSHFHADEAFGTTPPFITNSCKRFYLFARQKLHKREKIARGNSEMVPLDWRGEEGSSRACCPVSSVFDRFERSKATGILTACTNTPPSVLAGLAAGLDCQPLDSQDLGIFSTSHLSSAYWSGVVLFFVFFCEMCF